MLPADCGVDEPSEAVRVRQQRTASVAAEVCAVGAAKPQSDLQCSVDVVLVEHHIYIHGTKLTFEPRS